jgi:hypothetical protein
LCAWRYGGSCSRVFAGRQDGFDWIPGNRSQLGFGL